MVCDGAGSSLTSTSTIRPSSRGARRDVGIGDERRWRSARGEDRRPASGGSGRPALNRAMTPTWSALNGGSPLTRIAPNCATGPGLDRQRQRRELGLVIDDDVLLADLGRARSPSCPSALLERDAGGDDVLGDDRVAVLDREGRRAASHNPRPPPRARASSTDGEAILRARLGLEHDLEAASPDPSIRGCDHRVIIAAGCAAISASSSASARERRLDLRGIGGRLAVLPRAPIACGRPRASASRRRARRGLRSRRV